MYYPFIILKRGMHVACGHIIMLSTPRPITDAIYSYVLYSILNAKDPMASVAIVAVQVSVDIVAV